MTMLLIGLTGERGVGKSEVANILEAKHNFYKLHSFAPGKAMCKALFMYAGAPEEEAERMINGDLKDVPSPYLPNNDTPRFVMEEQGYFMPNRLGVAYTLGLALRKARQFYNEHHFIVESLVHEEAEFRRNNGIIIRVVRPGHKGPDGTYTDSAQALIKEDYQLINDGDLKDLRVKVGFLLSFIRNKLALQH